MAKTRGLGQRLATGFGICTLITACFSIYAVWEVRILGQEQDLGAERSRDAAIALEASQVPERDYSIIADMIINRNLEEIGKDWNAAKEADIKLLEAAEKVADTPEEKNDAKAAKDAWLEIVQIVDKELLPLLNDKNTPMDVISKIDGRMDEKKKFIGEKLRAVSKALEKEAAEADEDFDQTRKSIFAMSILFGILAVVVAASTATLIIRSVTKRIRTITDSLSDGSTQVSDASSKIAETSSELSSSATEQASAIQETVSCVDEVNAMVAKNAENAKKSHASSQSSSDAATRGKTAVDKMIQAIGDIDRTNKDVTQQIMDGNRRIGEITKVIAAISEKTKVINDIVFQTKLLSFNASVEAARAGEHGKGFAVVAEEVGTLATMSGTAAKEISELLEESVRKVETIVQETTKQVEHLTSTSKDKIHAGTKTAEGCGAILSEIVESISEVTRLAEEISTASQEQAQGVHEISKAMGQLDEVTHQNTKASEQAAAAGEQLSSQAGNLAQMVRELREVIEGSNGAVVASVPMERAAISRATRKRASHEVNSPNAEPALSKLEVAVETSPPAADDPRFKEV